MKPIRIAVDFDGTIVEHMFPKVGPPVPQALEWLRLWKAVGCTLILWTMRSAEHLEEAVEWCRSQGLEFDAVNQGPGDRTWTDSPKVYAHIYIDDAAFGCPLQPGAQGSRPMVDWSLVGPAVTMRIMGDEKES